MGDYLVSISGTATGAQIAVMLALISAMAHATFGVMQKTDDDPLLVRAGIDIWFFILALPIAVFAIQMPNRYEWLLIAGMIPIHTAYKWVLAGAYRSGEFTAVYPVARGSAPLFTALAAGLFFGEHFTGLQWLGVLVLSTAIMALSVWNLRKAHLARAELQRGLCYALATGAMITVYTIYDAFGMRESRDPLTFLAWFFVVDGVAFPLIAAIKRKKYAPRNGYGKIFRRGFIAAIFGIISFGSVMIGARIGHVGEVAAIRETSVVFAAILGWIFLRERVGPIRLIIIAFIALGAVFVEIGGV